MPLVRIDMTEGRSDDELKTLLDTAQECAVDAFEVPERDRYQIVTEHKPGRMILLDTGLGFERTEAAIVVQVFTSPRETTMKEKYCKLMADRLQTNCNLGHDVQSYLWLMTLISLLTAGLSYVVMVSVGLDQPAFWALLIFILNFIPTIGSIVATALPSLYSLLQFGDLWPFLVLLVAIGTIQFLIGNILQPRLAANTLNLSQFVVILSLFIWGAIWGVVGMFLAVPITSIAMIVCSNVPALRSVAIILSGSGQAASGEVMTEAPVQPG